MKIEQSNDDDDDDSDGGNDMKNFELSFNSKFNLNVHKILALIW